MPEITGFSFPNDVHVTWSLMIVMYPYITGFVAGSFIVTSLYHLFDRQEFKPVARLAMATSFAFLLVASLPLHSRPAWRTCCSGAAWRWAPIPAPTAPTSARM